MAAGLRCWDAQGRLTLNITDSITRMLGSVTTSMEAGGQITNPAFAQGRPWYDVRVGLYEGYPHPDGTALYRPQVSFSGTTMSWSRGVTSTITYGVY